MKKFCRKYSHVLTAFAFIFASIFANMTCPFWNGQDEEPEGMKALRKF